MSLNQILGIACFSCDGNYPETLLAETNGNGELMSSVDLFTIKLTDNDDTLHAPPIGKQWSVLNETREEETTHLSVKSIILILGQETT